MAYYNCHNCGKTFWRAGIKQKAKFCCIRCCFDYRFRDYVYKPRKQIQYESRYTHGKTCPTCGVPITNRSRGCSKHPPPKPCAPYKTEEGYVKFRVNGKTKLMHRIVWEEANGKPLPDDWIIHHFNGIRDDNRIENLVAIHKDKHERNTYIKKLQERIRQLEQLHLPI